MSEEARGTAYHEAGHAVVAVAMRVRLERVSTVRDDVRRLGGHAALPLPRRADEVGVGRLRPSYLRQRLVVTLAGPISEIRALGLPMDGDWEAQTGAGHDMTVASAYARHLAGGDEERATELLLDCWTLASVRVTQHWQAIGAVAEALMQSGELTGDVVRELVRKHPPARLGLATAQ